MPAPSVGQTMLVGRTRCLSWDQEPELHLVRQEDSLYSPATCPAAAASAAGATALAPPLPTLKPGRAERVAQLQAYLADLRRCTELPEAFPFLVERVLDAQRETFAAERGAFYFQPARHMQARV